MKIRISVPHLQALQIIVKTGRPFRYEDRMWHVYTKARAFHGSDVAVACNKQLALAAPVQVFDAPEDPVHLAFHPMVLADIDDGNLNRDIDSEDPLLRFRGRMQEVPLKTVFFPEKAMRMRKVEQRLAFDHELLAALAVTMRQRPSPKHGIFSAKAVMEIGKTPTSPILIEWEGQGTRGLHCSIMPNAEEFAFHWAAEVGDE